MQHGIIETGTVEGFVLLQRHIYLGITIQKIRKTEAVKLIQTPSLPQRSNTEMLAPSDILQFLRGQPLQTQTLPKASYAGKTVVITGANTGLGLECAKQLYVLMCNTLAAFSLH